MSDDVLPQDAVTREALGDAGAIRGPAVGGQVQAPGGTAPIANAPRSTPGATPKVTKTPLAISLNSTIGALGDEQPLALPEKGDLSADWGDAGKMFGGDKKMEEFLGRVRQRMEERGAKGPPIVAASLEWGALAAEYLLMKQFHRNSEIRTHKWNWLKAMLSRLDMATVEQEGVNCNKWARDPHVEAAPTVWEPVPDGIPNSEKFDKVSDAMATFLTRLKGPAGKAGYSFEVANRKDHSNGHGLDVRLTDTAKPDGFWDPNRAAGFLKLFGKAANPGDDKQPKVWWHVIYNDPRVSYVVNKFYKDQEGEKRVYGKVTYGGSYRKTKKGDIKENYHGPDPLKLHFHLDVMWP